VTRVTDRDRPEPTRVLIAGGGVAALETMLALRHHAGERVEVRMVAPLRDFVHRPLAVAEPFGPVPVHRFDLDALATGAGAALISSKVVEVAPDEHRVVTDEGAVLAYDHLVVACGARPSRAFDGALTFWGIADGAEMTRLLADVSEGRARRIAFAAHAGIGWHLPLYELALLTACHLEDAGVTGVRIVLVTHEADPLEVFGSVASQRARDLFEKRGIELITDRHPVRATEGSLEVVPAGTVDVDRVVTLPRLDGPGIEGLPTDDRGFIPTDGFGRVPDLPDVYAAGDATTFPVKQGGLATQQAAAVATTIASLAGAPVEPEPFRPVLRGLMLTGDQPEVMSRELRGGTGETSSVGRSDDGVLAGKIAGGFLASHLTEIGGGTLAGFDRAAAAAAAAAGEAA